MDIFLRDFDNDSTCNSQALTPWRPFIRERGYPNSYRLAIRKPQTDVYGVALHSEGHIDQAISTLVRAAARHPTDVDILEALVSYYRNRGDEIWRAFASPCDHPQ